MELHTIAMIAGAVVVAGSILFALINMGVHSSAVFSDDVDGSFSVFEGFFIRHVGAMIGMIIGGLAFVLGLIIFLARLLS